MGKIEVNGKNQSPVYTFLQVKSGDTSPVSWNFGKHLVRAGPMLHGGQLTAWLPSGLKPGPAHAGVSFWGTGVKASPLAAPCMKGSCRADLAAADGCMLAADTHPASFQRT